MIDWENIQLDEEEQQIENEVEQYVPISDAGRRRFKAVVERFRKTPKLT